MGEVDFKKILPGVLSGELGMRKNDRLNVFSDNVNSTNSTSILERYNPKEFKEIWKDVSLRLILKEKGGKNTAYQFVGSNLWV